MFKKLAIIALVITSTSNMQASLPGAPIAPSAATTIVTLGAATAGLIIAAPAIVPLFTKWALLKAVAGAATVAHFAYTAYTGSSK